MSMSILLQPQASKWGSFVLASCLALALSAFPLTAESKGEKGAGGYTSAPQTLLVTKVDGKGVAKIRRAKGTIRVTAVGDRLSEGDRVLTDGASFVEALLGDGSLVRIAPNTDYEFKKFSQNDANGVFTWAFGLARGGVRAIVEKKDNKKRVVKFKVNTPAGTMGVRGTELLLLHDQASELTTLYTLSGEVVLGPADANVNQLKIFQVVSKDFMSTIRKGDKRASTPRRFTLDEVLKEAIGKARAGSGSTSEEDGLAGNSAVMSSLLLSKDQSAIMDLTGKSNLSDSDLERLRAELAKTTQQMNEVQDYLSDYQGLENQKVAAVFEGLSLEQQGAAAASGGDKASSASSSKNDGKNGVVNSKTTETSGTSKALSRAAAEQLAKSKVDAHVADLRKRKSILFSGEYNFENKSGTSSDPDLERLRDDLASAGSQGATAEAEASKPVCTMQKVCKGGFFGLFEKCSMVEVCPAVPSAPNPEQYPAAAEVSANLTQALNDPAPKTLPANDSNKESGKFSHDEDDQKKAKGKCCELWVPCFELKNESCSGKGKTIEVCDDRCKTTTFGK